MCRSKSFAIFRNALLKSGRPHASPVYGIHNPTGLRLLIRLRLGLSHLNEHRFNHNFQNCINPLCSCSVEMESTSHFFLHCHYFSNIRTTLLRNVSEIVGNISNLTDVLLVQILLFGDPKYSQVDNSHIINASIKFVMDSERFSGSFL